MTTPDDPNNRVAIIGTLPPPYGGVTVHIRRKLQLLKDAGVPYRLYEQTGKSSDDQTVVAAKNGAKQFLKLMWSLPEKLVHFHTNRLYALAVGTWILRRRGVGYTITVHSEQPERFITSKNRLKRWLFNRAFQKAQHLICVNSNIQRYMHSIGVEQNKTTVLPAFLPPTPEERSPKNIPDDVQNFASRFDQIVGSHGWFGYFVNGNHLYSFDHLVKLAEHLKNNRPGVGMFTIISGTKVNEDDHRTEIMNLRKEKGLTDSWMIIESQFAAAGLLENSDVFVRPTTSDGDSVSIRECLFLGTPVVASDAAVRPAGCKIFPTRDYDQMLAAVCKALDEPSDGTQNESESSTAQFGRQLVRIFRKELEDSEVK